MDGHASMGSEGRRFAWITIATSGLATCMLDCAPKKVPELEWMPVWCEVDVYGREANLAIPSMTNWTGVFRTNFFSLLLVPVGTDGYILELENLTRYPIELDWRRTLLIDSSGWTHPLVYPGGERSDGHHSEANLPILVAPFAKRRVVLLSRIIFSSDEFPFRPDFRDKRFLRPDPSPTVGELTEHVLLSFRFRDEDLAYRFAVKLKPEAAMARKKVPIESETNVETSTNAK